MVGRDAPLPQVVDDGAGRPGFGQLKHHRPAAPVLLTRGKGPQAKGVGHS